MKKQLSLLLILTILSSLLPIEVYADNDTFSTEIEMKEYCQLISIYTIDSVSYNVYQCSNFYLNGHYYDDDYQFYTSQGIVVTDEFILNKLNMIHYFNSEELFHEVCRSRNLSAYLAVTFNEMGFGEINNKLHEYELNNDINTEDIYVALGKDYVMDLLTKDQYHSFGMILSELAQINLSLAVARYEVFLGVSQYDSINKEYYYVSKVYQELSQANVQLLTSYQNLSDIIFEMTGYRNNKNIPTLAIEESIRLKNMSIPQILELQTSIENQVAFDKSTIVQVTGNNTDFQYTPVTESKSVAIEKFDSIQKASSYIFNNSMANWTTASFKNILSYNIVPNHLLVRNENSYVTRLDFTNLIVNTLEAYDHTTLKENNTAFNDVEQQDRLSLIRKANEAGIIIGTSDRIFNPDGLITKAEMATILCNSINFKEPIVNYFSNDSYKDIRSNEWYSQYVNHINTIGIIQDNNTFNPYDYVTLNEALEMVNRLIEYLY